MYFPMQIDDVFKSWTYVKTLLVVFMQPNAANHMHTVIRRITLASLYSSLYSISGHLTRHLNIGSIDTAPWFTCVFVVLRILHNPTLHFIYRYATESYLKTSITHGTRKLIIKKANTREKGKERKKVQQQWKNKKQKRK